MVTRRGGLLATAALLALASNGNAAVNRGTGRIDQARLESAARDADNWLTYGRTYAEQRFSELAHVNDGNIGQLGLAWATELDTARGQEATPGRASCRTLRSLRLPRARIPLRLGPLRLRPPLRRRR